MIPKMLREIRSYVPLPIEEVTWDGNHLGLGGTGWGLGVLAPWRILRDGLMEKGSCDVLDTPAERLGLLGRQVVAAALREGAIDPHFELDDGSVLEVFSDSTLEPWIFVLGEGAERVVYPAAPSAPSMYREEKEP
jgi:hypothetical protein